MSQSDLYEIFVIFLVFVVTMLVIGIVCNPFFWQGLRNSKFFDELKRGKSKQDIDKLVKP